MYDILYELIEREKMCKLTQVIVGLDKDSISQEKTSLASRHIMGLFQLLDKIERRIQSEQQTQTQKSNEICYEEPNE